MKGEMKAFSKVGLPDVPTVYVMELTSKHIEALERIISDWIDEGFTTPPYPQEYYDIFEWLEIQSRQYDINSRNIQSGLDH